MIKLRTIALLAGALCLAGAAADLWLLPRAVPHPDQPLKHEPTKVLPDEDKLEALLGRLGPSVPAETRTKVADALMSEARRNGYDPFFLLALVGVESNYRITASSARGARGLLQLKPSTFAWMAAREPEVGAHELETGDDPATDVRLAVRYFHYLEHRFQSRTAALMAYNSGPRRVALALRDGELTDRMKQYPARVRKEYERVIRLAEGKRMQLDEGLVLLARAP
ncbi:MAG: transglycosylase SLT domain-containing protein [Deltaproteobacteria bacterium]|nr:transglycosylase SLT domain-containing protein [Deltaproteobacteria bacterium]